MSHAPNTEFLKDISSKLNLTGIPIFFKLPDKNEIEPFYVIGTHFDDDSSTAKFGKAIINTDLQIDLFYPSKSRTDIEDIIYKTKMYLGRRNKVTSELKIDNTIGREVYHVVFRVSDYII